MGQAVSESHEHNTQADAPRSTDPRRRPHDPAGTRPKVDPESLLPSTHPGQLALTPGTSTPQSAPALALSGEHGLLPDSGSTARAIAVREPRTSHASRFQFLIGALVAIGGTAIAVTVAIVTGPAPKPGVAWSFWRPVSGAGDPAEQIALHVAPQYRLPDGHELVQVTGGPQAVGGQPVVLALRSSGSEPSALPNDGVFYQLCGTGPHCSIPGKASVERALLVKREALELALYTFHYISQSSQVLVTFPPPPPTGPEKKSASAKQSSSLSSTISSTGSQTTPSHVLLFRPSDLATELARPLEETLPAKAPTITAMNRSPEAPLVNRLTLNAIYDSTLTQQESTLVMLLQAPSLGG
jgi:hypothetical protein